MILNQDAHHCDAQNNLYNAPLTILGSPAKTDEGTAIQNWIEELRKDASYTTNRLNEEGRYIQFGHEYLFETKASDGWPIYYAIAESKPPFADSWNSLSWLRGCMMVETAANVLDVTLDKETGKHAILIYKKVEGPTVVGKAILASSIARLLDQDLLRAFPEKEYQAEFRKLDGTGWELVSSNKEVPRAQ